MPYSIFVRRIDALRSKAEPLANDIESPKLAVQLAQGIAGSYPTHGCDLARAAFWFVSRLGLHELLIAPSRKSTERKLPHVLDSFSLDATRT